MESTAPTRHESVVISDIVDGNMPEFTFVQVDMKPDYRAANYNKYAIRSHAQKITRRRRKAANERRSNDDCEDGEFARSKTSSVLSQSLQVDRDRTSGADGDALPQEIPNGQDLVLATIPQFMPERLPARERQLMGHNSSLFAPLFDDPSERFGRWTDGIKLLMKISHSHQFVLQAILAWSATHLSWITKNSQTMQEAYSYRAAAYHNLQAAIEDFSADNSDAILAASVMMAWQATDALGWTTLIGGVSMVKRFIIQRKIKSYLLDKSRLKTTEPISTKLDSNKASDTLRQTHKARELLLRHALQSLIGLDMYCGHKSRTSYIVQELMALVQDMLEGPASSQPDIILEQLQILKMTLFWSPRTTTCKLHSDLSEMVLMAHLHAVALIVQPVASTGSVSFRSLNTTPIRVFYQEISEMSRSQSGVARDVYKVMLGLMVFPLEALSTFEAIHRDVPQETPLLDCFVSGQKDLAYDINDTEVSMLTVLTSFPVGLWYNDSVDRHNGRVSESRVVW